MGGLYADDSREKAIGFNRKNNILKNLEIWLGADDALHALRVFRLVALGARRANGWTTTKVQCLFLKRGQIGVESHFAAERIEFKDEMAFRESSNGRIARHSGDCIDKPSDQERLNAHARGDESRFGTCVSASDNDNLRMKIHAR